MSKKRRLEYSYKELQSSGLPDLWSRIEEGLEEEKRRQAHLKEKTDPAEKIIHKTDSGKKNSAKTGNHPGRRNSLWKYGTGFAAAAVCLLLTTQIGRKHEIRMQEANGNQMAAGGEQDGVSREQSGTIHQVVWYEKLSLSGTEAASPPKEAVYASTDSLYFTEEALKQSSALGWMWVEQVSYEKNEDSDLWTVCYDLIIREALSGGGALREGQRLQVKSPLIGASSEGLYVMKEGGDYLLPLTRREGGWELTFPCAPQIEQTRDGGYIFHTGWQSLLTENTVIVMKEQQDPEDYYYDRMVLREDPEFVSDLILLAGSMQEENRSEEEQL